MSGVLLYFTVPVTNVYVTYFCAFSHQCPWQTFSFSVSIFFSFLTVSLQPGAKCWLRSFSVFSPDAANESTATESPGESPSSPRFTGLLPSSTQTVCGLVWLYLKASLSNWMRERLFRSYKKLLRCWRGLELCHIKSVSDRRCLAGRTPDGVFLASSACWSVVEWVVNGLHWLAA